MTCRPSPSPFSSLMFLRTASCCTLCSLDRKESYDKPSHEHSLNRTAGLRLCGNLRGLSGSENSIQRSTTHITDGRAWKLGSASVLFIFRIRFRTKSMLAIPFPSILFHCSLLPLASNANRVSQSSYEIDTQ